MANQWFKFYGAEYLSDPKMDRLTVQERSCWLTLLCMASQSKGVVKFLSIEGLLNKSGIRFNPYDSTEWDNALGVLQTFEQYEMIIVHKNGDVEIKNWEKRQEHNQTVAERVAKSRAKKKSVTMNVTNVTTEENRIDKKRIEEVLFPIDEFWSIYPNKIAKANAVKSWNKLSAGERRLAILAIKKQIEANHFMGHDGKSYIPHPTTWLNQKRWEDEVKEPVTTKVYKF